MIFTGDFKNQENSIVTGEVPLCGISLDDAIFRGANLNNVNFTEAKLRRAQGLQALVFLIRTFGEPTSLMLNSVLDILVMPTLAVLRLYAQNSSKPTLRERI